MKAYDHLISSYKAIVSCRFTKLGLNYFIHMDSFKGTFINCFCKFWLTGFSMEGQKSQDSLKLSTFVFKKLTKVSWVWNDMRASKSNHIIQNSNFCVNLFKISELIFKKCIHTRTQARTHTRTHKHTHTHMHTVQASTLPLGNVLSFSLQTSREIHLAGNLKGSCD